MIISFDSYLQFQDIMMRIIIFNNYITRQILKHYNINLKCFVMVIV